MFKVPLLTLTLITLIHVAATAQDTVWYDTEWKLTTIHPYFFRTKARTDSGWLVTDHFPSGKPQMIGLFADGDLKIRQGVCRWFFQDGTVNHLQTFVANKVNGLEQYYYDNGSLQQQGMTNDTNRVGEWRAYFPSGKLAAKAQYIDNKRVKTTLFKEDGMANAKDTIFYHAPEYPGGPARFLYFLNKHLRYPDSAVVHEIEGTVMVRFHVSKEGKVSNLVVEQSVNPWLDAEALRVLALMGDWEPAVLAGVKVEGFRQQPVIFRLTSI
jgi:TonB family protein